MGAVVCLAHSHGEDRVSHHPGDDHISADSAVVVFLLLSFGEWLFLHLDTVAEVAEGFVVTTIDVKLLARHLQLDSVAFAGDCGAEIDVNYIVAFRAPSYVMGVAEGVHLQCADVGWEEGEVLGTRCKHMPRVQIEKGHEEV